MFFIINLVLTVIAMDASVVFNLYLKDTGTEEKRIKHQAELAEKLNADARERLRGMKVGVDDKK